MENGAFKFLKIKIIKSGGVVLEKYYEVSFVFWDILDILLKFWILLLLICYKIKMGLTDFNSKYEDSKLIYKSI